MMYERDKYRTYKRTQGLMEVVALSKISGIETDELLKYKLPKYYDTYKVHMEYMEATKPKE